MSARLVTAIVLALAPAAAPAEEWKTPDGNASVAAPDAARFTKLDQPGALAFWQSRDGSVRLLVGEMAAPPSVKKLERAPVEKGMLKEMNTQMRNAQLLDSSTEARDGHEVLAMTARAEQDGVVVYFSQCLGLGPGKAYKALAVGFGKDPRTDPDASRFLASFRLLAAPVAGGDAAPAPAAPAQPVAANRIAYNAGQIAGMCLFVALVVWVLRRLTGGGGSKPPRRKRDDWDEDE